MVKNDDFEQSFLVQCKPSIVEFKTKFAIFQYKISFKYVIIVFSKLVNNEGMMILNKFLNFQCKIS